MVVVTRVVRRVVRVSSYAADVAAEAFREKLTLGDRVDCDKSPRRRRWVSSADDDADAVAPDSDEARIGLEFMVLRKINDCFFY